MNKRIPVLQIVLFILVGVALIGLNWIAGNRRIQKGTNVPFNPQTQEMIAAPYLTSYKEVFLMWGKPMWKAIRFSHYGIINVFSNGYVYCTEKWEIGTEKATLNDQPSHFLDFVHNDEYVSAIGIEDCLQHLMK